MKWLSFLSSQKIPYYVYKLNREDSIIIHKYSLETNQSIIVAYGSIYVSKIFTNTETLPIALLGKNSIFIKENNNINNEFYYQLTALETTYIISFKEDDLKGIVKFRINLIGILISSYKKTIEEYEAMNQVMCQRYLKNRIYQLILLICLKFGIISDTKIQIPFQVSNKHIATITGTNTTNISKLLRNISKNLFIKISNKKKIYINNIFEIRLK
uniref:Global nitrogen transcriptional regulator n=1 Tax=Alsidium seaforthii TaxID=2007182 RepID=A0A1Z1MDT3_9FLOR|nr:global nitrogen transcriptional regulator [Bryothamnion seaforthii]ARW64032.1 global nitrogen transcriptional regulator [Bryothamnion seaforthii]